MKKSCALFFLILLSISYADTGNSTSYLLSVQENAFAGTGSSSGFGISVDSSSGIGSSASYRIYEGFAPFLATFEQIPYPPLVNFTSLAGESVVYQSTTARFQLSVRNLRDASSTVVPRMFIYNSAGALVYQRTGSSVTMEGGTNVSLLQYSTLIFSVGTVAAGTHNATFNLLYTDENNATQATHNKSVLFEIRALAETSSSSSSSSSGVSYYNYVMPIKSEDDVEEPAIPEKFVEFGSVPALIEVLSGEERTETITIHNIGEAAASLSVRLDGIPEGWTSLSDSFIALNAGEEQDVAIIISIPKDTLPGNYQGKISISDGKLLRESVFILRINNPIKTQDVEKATVSKTAYINEGKKKTDFVIKVKNGKSFSKKLTITERIDKRIAEDSDELVFDKEPSRILERDPLIEWLFTDVEPNGERNITYSVKKIVNTTKAFVALSVEQVTTQVGSEFAEFQEFQVDYKPLMTGALFMLLMGGVYSLYRLERRMRRQYFYKKGMKSFIGKEILTSESARKLGTVADITFMPNTGEVMEIVIKHPTMYAKSLLSKQDTKHRLYVSFQCIKSVGDYVMIKETDIIFENVMKRKPLETQKDMQTKISEFFNRPARIRKMKVKTV